MKKIECIIRPMRLEAVKSALGELGITGMTVTDVRGIGTGDGAVGQAHGAAYAGALPPKIKLEVVAADEDVDEVIETVLLHARTGSPGDGKIFVLPAGRAVRIRTGDEGEGVL
jgi:nitrogen regulatory protein P-II 1